MIRCRLRRVGWLNLLRFTKVDTFLGRPTRLAIIRSRADTYYRMLRISYISRRFGETRLNLPHIQPRTALVDFRGSGWSAARKSSDAGILETARAFSSERPRMSSTGPAEVPTSSFEGDVWAALDSMPAVATC